MHALFKLYARFVGKGEGYFSARIRPRGRGCGKFRHGLLDDGDRISRVVVVAARHAYGEGVFTDRKSAVFTRKGIVVRGDGKVVEHGVGAYSGHGYVRFDGCFIVCLRVCGEHIRVPVGELHAVRSKGEIRLADCEGELIYARQAVIALRDFGNGSGISARVYRLTYDRVVVRHDYGNGHFVAANHAFQSIFGNLSFAVIGEGLIAVPGKGQLLCFYGNIHGGAAFGYRVVACRRAFQPVSDGVSAGVLQFGRFAAAYNAVDYRADVVAGYGAAKAYAQPVNAFYRAVVSEQDIRRGYGEFRRGNGDYKVLRSVFIVECAADLQSHGIAARVAYLVRGNGFRAAHRGVSDSHIYNAVSSGSAVYGRSNGNRACVVYHAILIVVNSERCGCFGNAERLYGICGQLVVAAYKHRHGCGVVARIYRLTFFGRVVARNGHAERYFVTIERALCRCGGSLCCAVVGEAFKVAPLYRNFLGRYHHGEVCGVGYFVTLRVVAAQNYFKAVVSGGIYNLRIQRAVYPVAVEHAFKSDGYGIALLTYIRQSEHTVNRICIRIINVCGYFGFAYGYGNGLIVYLRIVGVRAVVAREGKYNAFARFHIAARARSRLKSGVDGCGIAVRIGNSYGYCVARFQSAVGVCAVAVQYNARNGRLGDGEREVVFKLYAACGDCERRLYGISADVRERAALHSFNRVIPGAVGLSVDIEVSGKIVRRRVRLIFAVYRRNGISLARAYLYGYIGYNVDSDSSY